MQLPPEFYNLSYQTNHRCQQINVDRNNKRYNSNVCIPLKNISLGCFYRTPAVVEFKAHYKISKYITAASGRAPCFAVGLERQTKQAKTNTQTCIIKTHLWEKFRLISGVHFPGKKKTTSERCIGTHSYTHTHPQTEMHILTTLPVLALYHCQPSAPLFHAAL